jgi:hypothetical protein
MDPRLVLHAINQQILLKVPSATAVEQEKVFTENCCMVKTEKSVSIEIPILMTPAQEWPFITAIVFSVSPMNE